MLAHHLGSLCARVGAALALALLLLSPSAARADGPAEKPDPDKAACRVEPRTTKSISPSPLRQPLKEERQRKIAAALELTPSECEKALKRALDESPDQETPTPQELTQSCADKRFKRVKESGVAGLAVLASGAAGTEWQTALATGLANFLGDRAQQELALWLESQLGDQLCGTPAKAYLPRTCAIVTPACGYADSAKTTLLASAIRKDLEALPLRALVQLAKDKGVKLHVSEAVVDAFTDFMEQLRKGAAPLELLAGLGDEGSPLADACLDKTAPAGALNVGCLLYLTGRVVWHLGDATARRLTPEEVKALVVVLRVQLPKADVDEKKVGALAGAVFRLEDNLRSFAKRGVASTAESLGRAGDVLQSTLAVVDAGVAFSWKPASAEWRTVRATLGATADLMRGDYAEGLRQVVEVLAASGSRDAALPPALRQYLSLAVDLAAARTAPEVQAALNAAAAPVGSYRIKRRAFTLSVTGLVGGVFGAEIPLGTKLSQHPASMHGGALGAVGLDLAWPIRSTRSTAGLYFSVLDVGQLLTVPILPQEGKKTENGVEVTTTAKPGGEIRLAQVLSPGAYVRFGLGDSPFTLAFGGAFAPELRNYEKTSAAGKSLGNDVLTTFRFGLVLAVDITILPLYHAKVTEAP